MELDFRQIQLKPNVSSRVDLILISKILRCGRFDEKFLGSPLYTSVFKPIRKIRFIVPNSCVRLLFTNK